MNKIKYTDFMIFASKKTLMSELLLTTYGKTISITSYINALFLVTAKIQSISSFRNH